MILSRDLFQNDHLTYRFDSPRCIAMQAAYAKNSKPRMIPMSLLVREVLQRLPKTSEWVFTKANGTRILPFGDFSSPRTIIGLPVGSSEVWRGDGAAERAGL